jgi:N-acetylmuramoyl-L-alanine amidase-like protein
VLVPAWSAPARTITVPVTLARSVELDAPAGGRSPGVTFDFPPTHLAFEWTSPPGGRVQYRTATDDGGLSRWRTAREDEDAAAGDVHFSAALEVDRPDSIQWRAAGHASGLTDVSLDYLNTLDGPRRAVTVPALAQAAAHTPDIVTRAEWGADESVKHTSGSCRRVFYPVQQLFVHHTAGVNDDPRPKATMRAIYYFHVRQRGWCDVGYNFVIAPDGTIFEGRWARSYAPWETHTSENVRDEAVVGAHVAGFNSGSVGISLMGNYSQVPLPPDARRSLAELLAWEADRHHLAPTGSHVYNNPDTHAKKKLRFISGHRDAGQTECPGNFVYASLPAIRRDAKAVIGGGKADSDMSFSADPRKTTYGSQVTLSGRVTEGAGTGVAGQDVIVYARAAGQWSQAATVSTGADGSFTYALTPDAGVTVRAVYDGDAKRWGSQSKDVSIQVVPNVGLAAEGGVDAGGIKHYPPGTTQVVLSGTVDPPHPGRTVVVHVAEIGSDGTPTPVAKQSLTLDDASSYSYVFAVPDSLAGGTFRAVTWFKSDGDHATGPSAPVTFVVDPTP